MPRLAPLSAALLLAFLALPAAAQNIHFGDDSGEYPRDGECDDRRFYGTAMATGLNWRSVGKDASDCKSAYESGRVSLWKEEDARAATVCSAIKWGDDSSEYSNDGACDDPRFEGRGAAEILLQDDAGRDASDCRNLCEYGLIFLREY
jgi:hypothetical protein